MKEKKIIDGKKIAQNIYLELKKEIENIYKKTQTRPKFEIILANKTKASEIYVSRKIKIANELGIETILTQFDENIREEEVVFAINRINNDENIHAAIIQLPLPFGLNSKKICNLLDFKKDVDGLSAVNCGMLNLGIDDVFFQKPCTAVGCIKLLDEYKINVKGKKCLIINRSNIVGKPLSTMLLKRNAFVQIAHSEAGDFSKELLDADIVFSAVGKKNFINQNMIKAGVILFDIGISHDENGLFCGDVDFQSCIDKCSMITPVPGGVGQMTVAILMQNIVYSFKNFLKI